jgi:hypothetical protein
MEPRWNYRDRMIVPPPAMRRSRGGSSGRRTDLHRFFALNRGTSSISYSSLNSLRVIDRSRATSRTPLCANSMILDATKRVAGSSLSRRPNSAHTLSSTTDMVLIASGSKADPSRRYGRIGIPVPQRPLAYTSAVVRVVPIRIVVRSP